MNRPDNKALEEYRQGQIRIEAIRYEDKQVIANLEDAIIEWANRIGEAEGVLFDPPAIILEIIERREEQNDR